MKIKSIALKENFWVGILPLFLSLIIYLFCRPHDVAVNRLFDFFLPHSSLILEYNISNWIIYNLPGALWVFSFQAIFITKNKKGILFCLIPLFGALAIEVLQFFNLTDGTFDVLDIIFYLLSWTLFMVFWISKGNKINGFRSSEKISLSEFSILAFFFSILILADVF